jgi:hypothetical protein
MPPFKMSLSKEQVEGKEVLPAGLYEVRFIKFNPKLSKANAGNPDAERSINLNAEYEVINHPEYATRKLYEVMNMKSYNIQNEVCHAFGVPLESGVGDTGEVEYWIPGTWDNKPGFNPADPSTFEYKGPLIGQVAKVEVAVDNYQGRDNNKVRRYFCAIDDCATKFPEIRHSDNLLRS